MGVQTEMTLRWNYNTVQICFYRSFVACSVFKMTNFTCLVGSLVPEKPNSWHAVNHRVWSTWIYQTGQRSLCVTFQEVSVCVRRPHGTACENVKGWSLQDWYRTQHASKGPLKWSHKKLPIRNKFFTPRKLEVVRWVTGQEKRLRQGGTRHPNDSQSTRQVEQNHTYPNT